MVKVSVDLEGLDSIEDFGERLSQGVSKGLNYATQELLSNLHDISPHDNNPNNTGLLRKWVARPKSKFEYNVKSPAKYVGFVNDGTGIYGPSGKPIHSKKPGKPLVFNYDGKTVFAMSVKGQKPQKFVEKSIAATQPKVEKLMIRAFIENDGGA